MRLKVAFWLSAKASHLAQTPLTSPQGSMVLAASCCGDAFHRQSLETLAEMMDGAKYKHILEENLFRPFRELRSERRSDSLLVKREI